MFFAQTIDSWITLTGALIGCWYAYRSTPPGPKQAEWEAWHQRWGRLLRVLAPLLAVVAIGKILIQLRAQ